MNRRISLIATLLLCGVAALGCTVNREAADHAAMIRRGVHLFRSATVAREDSQAAAVNSLGAAIEAHAVELEKLCNGGK